MGDRVTTAARDRGGRSRRLSPKVRRLLREHDLEAARVRGTGIGGRITPADVERRAHGSATRPAPRPGRGARPVLASPLARRLLREAGVDPVEVTGTGPDHGVTGRDAARAIERARSATTASEDVATLAVDVDLTRLLLDVAAARDAFRRRTGTELTPLAPVVHATCRSLRRHPVCNGSHAPTEGGAAAQHDVDLGIVTPDGDLLAPTLACAQDLTVTALAERIARLRGGGGETDGDRTGTFTVGEGRVATLSWERQAAALALGPVEQRSVTIADEFGHDAVTTRWQATLHLAHDPRRVDEDAATAFLADLRRELESVDLLAGAA